MSHPAAPAASRPAPHRPPASSSAAPAPTLEGWYVHHQLFSIDRAALRSWNAAERAEAAASAAGAIARLENPDEGGWSVAAELTGSDADVMLVHFRPDLDSLRAAQTAVLRERIADVLRPASTFLSVCEAGMYATAAKLAGERRKEGLEVAGEEYEAELARRVEEEKENPHVKRRLYPQRPGAEMPWVCFYPMSKRRVPGQNWYELPLDERSRLMWEHGMTGRKHAGRVSQVVSGAIGFDAWEWGVTLFAVDPLEFKSTVTEMRYDTASARYAEFGRFWVGRMLEPRAWAAAVLER